MAKILRDVEKEKVMYHFPRWRYYLICLMCWIGGYGLKSRIDTGTRMTWGEALPVFAFLGVVVVIAVVKWRTANKGITP